MSSRRSDACHTRSTARSVAVLRALHAASLLVARAIRTFVLRVWGLPSALLHHAKGARLGMQNEKICVESGKSCREV
jgi:hypothetical protein